MTSKKAVEGHRMQRPPRLNLSTGRVENCECGAGLGDPWASAADEAAWHREHKAAVLAARAAEGPYRKETQ